MTSGSRILSVKEVSQYLRALLESDPILSNVVVKGEISNYKRHYSSGHLYFTLKDEAASIRCVMFRSRVQGLAFEPSNGMLVLALGYISVFDRDGQYQLYVQELKPGGLGALHIQFEKLKSKLQDEGLFDRQRKRSLPLLPRKVGVITSLNGAAVKDIISISRRRFPGAHLVLKDVLVQGEGAPRDICKAISCMNSVDGVDVIILGRGGGSLEELWAFNTEEVARAIHASRVPIVSAVGHETDFTIADFVADIRAATPSAAAEIVFVDKLKLLKDIDNLQKRLAVAEGKLCGQLRLKLDGLMGKWPFSRPDQLMAHQRLILDQASRSLLNNVRQYVDRRQASIGGFLGRLNALDPSAVLRRGYSICRKVPSLDIINSCYGLNRGDSIEVMVDDGSIACTVENTSPKGNDCARQNGTL